jgi:serine/threonine protein kinase
MVSQQAFFPGELLLQTLFRNRYFIMSKVGAGGFGSVYQAKDIQNGDRLVALKEVCLQGLHPQAMLEATTAFQREVSVLSHLDHPHLPRVYEHFQTPGHWYLVMDFIAGETLEEYQSKAPTGRLLLSEVLEMGIQLCLVLHYLHSHHPPIVFRDLKPANIMRNPTGQLYLIDFGIARYFKPGQAKDTVALGSVGYAAPEQYGKAQTTPRADIYSLGAVLHQLLTASDPSEAPFRFRPLRPTSHADPGSLTVSMVDVLVNKLETLIASMLEMDVNKRPPDIAYVKQELQELSTLWSDICKSFWRPKLGYTQRNARQDDDKKEK